MQFTIRTNSWTNLQYAQTPGPLFIRNNYSYNCLIEKNREKEIDPTGLKKIQNRVE